MQPYALSAIRHPWAPSMASAHPAFEAYLYLCTYKHHPNIQELRKIRNAGDRKRLGLIPVTHLGNNWRREDMDVAGIETLDALAEDDIARLLAARCADIMIDRPFPMNPMIKSLGLTRQIELAPARFGPIGFHRLIDRKSSFSSSMGALNQAIDQFILGGTRERWTPKYLHK